MMRHGSETNAGTAGRALCTKLYLKAETQQVDRILVEFSRRWQECNPGNLFGSASKSSSFGSLQHAQRY
jgi:hypothetical protein